MLIAITGATLTDAALSANGSVIAVALASHPLAVQFGADSIEALAAISERSPPAVSPAEWQFLRDAIARSSGRRSRRARRRRNPLGDCFNRRKIEK